MMQINQDREQWKGEWEAYFQKQMIGSLISQMTTVKLMDICVL